MIYEGQKFKYCRYVIPLLECCRVVKHFQDLFFSHFNHEVYFWFHIMITWVMSVCSLTSSFQRNMLTALLGYN